MGKDKCVDRIRVALPATQTIVYSYTAEWWEK